GGVRHESPSARGRPGGAAAAHQLPFVRRQGAPRPPHATANDVSPERGSIPSRKDPGAGQTGTYPQVPYSARLFASTERHAAARSRPCTSASERIVSAARKGALGRPR